MKFVIQDILKGTHFSDTEIQMFQDKLQELELKKGEFLIRPGREVKDLFYIHSGCLRTYFTDVSGKEHTLQFAVKGWWISDYIALFSREKKPSVSHIECIKAAKLYKISKQDFDQLCDEIPALGRFHIKNLEAAFAAFQNRILANLTLSAKERYLAFIKTYPNIEQNVKNYHIASFLGITTESLSRIRKEILQS